VRDVALAGRVARGWLAHTKYWAADGPDGDKEHIKALQNAVNLADT
jgi:hypothetical protein